jgi:transposase
VKHGGANNSWSRDLGSGHCLLYCRWLRALTIAVDFTRECLTIAVDLDQFLAEGDAPKSIRANKDAAQCGRSVEEKRRIVEETLEAGASVARIARQHAVNANQVFYWRKKYREGRLGKRQSSKLLPVTLSDNALSKSGRAGCASSPFAVGTMEIKLSQGSLRVAGNVDVVVLRAAIKCLLG